MARPSLFLSSTAADLTAYRDVVIHVCQRLGIDVVAMEDFGPDPRAAAAVCREKVESADLFLGLYAHRYGYAPDGFGGSSITQLEYEWAIARRPSLPVLAFIIDDELLWPPKWIEHGEGWDRLQALKARLRKDHVIGALTTPEQLRDDLFVHLPRFAVSRPDPAPRPAQVHQARLPKPPEVHVAHQYTLLQTEDVVGRADELDTLDRWVSDPASPFTRARLLSVVAIGGMGKSALTWKWFHGRAAEAMAPLAGRLWWSFYESDAGFERFLVTALAYCTGRTLDEIQALSPYDREQQLLSVLDEQPFLLVLDGLERLLIAYSNLDFAHLADEDLDQRTANAVIGALGLRPATDASLVSRHRLRKTIDPRVGEFLRKLARVRAARILITTRLYPSELQTVTGHEIPGSAAWFLRGLAPSDALKLWRAMGVSGTDAQLEPVFASIENYPLLIRALAGEIAAYRPAPGDFDAWRRDHPAFNPFQLSMVQAKSHVLAQALGGLEANAAELLRTIAAFRAPVEYGTLSGLFVERQGWTPFALDTTLTQLEDRGLVGWDRAANRYDLHPIVRGVVWNGLGDIDKRAVYGTLEQHFSAIPSTNETVASVAEALIIIELFNALVGLRRYAEAANLYFDRLHDSEKFSFYDSGMNHINTAMLESLFANGLDQPPTDKTRAQGVLSQLGWAYQHAGRLEGAYALLLRVVDYASQHPIRSDGRALPHVFANAAKGAIPLGHLKAAVAHINEALSYTDDTSDTKHHIGALSVLEAMVGREMSALRRLAAQEPEEFYDPRLYEMEICLRRGEYGQAQDLIDMVSARSPKWAIECQFGQVELWLRTGRIEQAGRELGEYLRVARTINDVESELVCLLDLADAHLQLGDYALARGFLEDMAEAVARGPYRLIAADAANVLARLEVACGNRDAAVAAAQEAYRQAWCDGPEYSYHWALKTAEAMLAELGAPLP